MSIRAIAPALGLDLVEIEDWNCCGATAAHNTNHDLAVALSLRNLALAEAQGMKEVLAPCAACSSRLIFAHKAAAKDDASRKKYEDIIEMPYKGTVKTLNLLEAIRTHCMDALKAKVTKPLTGLRVACYYGCLLVRPPKVMEFDDPEAPKSMDEIVTALGCTPAD
jgi:heterodisulfide reductase subunit B